jgi:type II secretory pathway predicted ATPase ExeA
MPYRSFFGLDKEPFSNAPQTSFYYSSPQHERAIKKLTYAVDNAKGLAVLVGRVGSGKTMLARRMLAELPEERYAAALLVIVHSGFGADWLLKRIALQLGVVNPATEKLALVSQLYRRLIKLHEQKRTAVVLIDEAQMLETREIMEELRGLLNLEVPGRKLINFVLCGLPELDQTLAIDEPLQHRVAVRCELAPFAQSDTREYIRHRLMLAGARDASIFSSAALEAVHAWSGGTPRSINTLCDNALFEATLSETRVIGPEIIAQCGHDLNFPDPFAPPAPLVKPVTPAPPDDLELAEIDDLLRDLDRY